MTKTIQPIHFQPSATAIPAIILPQADTLFANRARRFEFLSERHPLGDWLRYLARLTHIQQELLASLREQPLPDFASRRQADQYGMPPLSVTSQPLPSIWHDILRTLIDGLMMQTPVATRPRLTALKEKTPQALDRTAKALLNGQPDPVDLPDLPLIAAALQTVWTAWASRLDPIPTATSDTPGLCPCCGSLPVSSIVRTGTEVNNLRYLHCSLCNSEWNLPRAVCASCQSDKHLAYQQIDGSNGAVRAECCDTCHSYLKMVFQEKDPGVDPVADDLATLALDMLIDEAGYSRSGPNLLLLGGAA